MKNCADVDYYAFPKELLANSKYANFSLNSKMLFSMALTEAVSASAIMELAKLIETIGYRNIVLIFSEASSEAKSHLENSED